ncbi:hypothetical protein KQI84_10805 [bacterium]|nr:hypothetical protein [bacterium]
MMGSTRRGFLFGAALILALAAVMPASAQYATLVRQQSLDSENGTTMPINDSWWGQHHHGKMSYAPNGTVGIVQKNVWTGTKVEVLMHEIDVWGNWVMTPVKQFSTSSVDYPMLAYDNANYPHVFVEQGSTWYQMWRINGVWSEQELDFDLTPIYGGPPDRFGSLMAAIHGLDGKVHVFFTARQTSSSPYELFQASAWDSYSWEIRNLGDYRSALTNGEFTLDTVFTIIVNHNGEPVLAFSSSEPWGDPNNLPRERLNWAVFNGSSWYSEVVEQGPNVDNKPAWDGCIAVDSNNTPHVLGTYTTHATTGSMQSMRLVYYRRTGTNSWAKETIVTHSDNYNGGDGTDYSGMYPDIWIDGTNRPHVVFADLSSWHWHCIEDMPEINCNDTEPGQLRYAYRDDGGTWRITKLFSQDGQSVSSNPLNMFKGHTVAVSPSGKTVHAFGMEHIHHSNTYPYDQDAPRDFQLIYFQAETALGSDEFKPQKAESIRDAILGIIPCTTTYDLNSDSAVDTGDMTNVLM